MSTADTLELAIRTWEKETKRRTDLDGKELAEIIRIAGELFTKASKASK